MKSFNIIKEGDGTKPIYLTFFLGVWILIGINLEKRYGNMCITFYIPFLKFRIRINTGRIITDLFYYKYPKTYQYLGKYFCRI
jgi:hypothetical protein